MALQTRILSTCTPSSAEPEALETLDPIKQGVWRPQIKCLSWERRRQQMARVLGFLIYIRGLANGPARAYLSRDSRQACPGQARRLNPSSRAVQRVIQLQGQAP